MTIEDIERLIAKDENRILELKKTTGELKEGMHSACAFLNTEGGWLMFGIAPKSLEILGQQVSDDTQREIAQALSYMYPAVDTRVEYIDVPSRPGNQVIALHFDGWVWGKEPYTYHGCPYYKVESTTKEMPRPLYDERVEIVNPGRLPNELTVESMMRPHDSFPMNPVIAEVMFKTKYLDSWGGGVERMIDACNEAGVALPHYELMPGGVAIVFPRPGKKRAESLSEGISWEQVGNKLGISWEEVEKLFVTLQHPSSLNELKGKYGWGNSAKFKEKYINPLLAEDIVAMTIPDKPTSPNQKYFLTDSGKDMLSRMTRKE